ncbi:MAG: GNAT family N-acetyltransferase [Armatimonadetes bacterium]|nr:GNAT family N-acetyltransferase [Armatimonadota bacterium]
MIEIGPYRHGDSVRLKEIAPHAFGVWARFGIDRTLPRDRVEALYRNEAQGYADRAESRDPTLAVLVARDEGRVVGYIVVSLDEGLSKTFGFRWGRITSLAVDPPRHGERIGPQLVAAGMAWLREQQCRYVEVWTDLNNIAAIRTYEAAGFRVIYSGVALSQLL